MRCQQIPGDYLLRFGDAFVTFRFASARIRPNACSKRLAELRMQLLCELCVQSNKLSIGTIVRHRLPLDKAPHLKYSLENC